MTHTTDELRDYFARLEGWKFEEGKDTFCYFWWRGAEKYHDAPEARYGHHSEGKYGKTHPISADLNTAAAMFAKWLPEYDWERFADAFQITDERGKYLIHIPDTGNTPESLAHDLFALTKAGLEAKEKR